MSALDETAIRTQLSTTAQQALRAMHIFAELDSTNRWALAHGQCGDVCLAEQQSAGRGRRGKVWQSPAGSNIYLSLRWCFASVPPQLSLLSLVTGVAVAEALSDCGIVGHKLKWPNDLYYDGKKFAGILLESVGTLEQVVIGIGINVNMLPSADLSIEQAWTSLQLMTQQAWERNRLIAALLNRLLTRLQGFAQMRFADFQQDWQRWDMLQGQTVQIIENTTSYQGYACGIDAHGQLRVRLPNGLSKQLTAAEVSVRRA